MFLTFQIAMQPSLNHMVISYPMGIPKATMIWWIVPGSSKDHLENWLKWNFCILIYNLILVPIFASKLDFSWNISYYFTPTNFSSSDSLEIYDGASTSSDLIGKFCGNSPPPSQIISSTNEILLHFETNMAGTYEGFHIHYNTLGKSLK